MAEAGPRAWSVWWRDHVWRKQLRCSGSDVITGLKAWSRIPSLKSWRWTVVIMNRENDCAPMASGGWWCT